MFFFKKISKINFKYFYGKEYNMEKFGSYTSLGKTHNYKKLCGDTWVSSVNENAEVAQLNFAEIGNYSIKVDNLLCS